MSKQGAFDLAFGVGGRIGKDEVLSAVDKYIYLSLSLCLYVFGYKSTPQKEKKDNPFKV